ncbi:MAG: membrane integrity-associated transporter subunit PqiC [Holophagaceae bacterium]|nr:membrane integrity-associated transporter subunit PqiC [Holophagaceae bacterium]
MIRATQSWTVLRLALALSAGLACSRPNLEVLHTLAPIAPPPANSAVPLKSMALEVMPVRLPETLQRPQMVVEIGPGNLSLLETHRWGNGLDKDIQRVLVENISMLTDLDTVVAYPYGERIKATHRLEVDIHRFDGKPGGTITLQATWMLTSPQGGPALLFRRTTIQRPVQGQDAEALVAAHSLIIGDLSREIATELQTLARGAP